MAINPQLATLMRVIEDNQDKMPEGEYLEAMNALGALHREAAVPAPAAQIQNELPPSYVASFPLFVRPPQEFFQMDPDDQLAFRRIKLVFPQHRNMSPAQWIALSREERNNLSRQSVEAMVDRKEATHRNSNPLCCPFIARHSIGSWRFGPGYENNEWTCVCGYTGKTKNWKKHEESERHVDWAKHRTVSRRTIEKMKRLISDDEAGDFIPFNPYADNQSGIRCFSICQEKNEWTHPELYQPLEVFTKPNCGTWFVHRRQERPRMYYE